MTRSGWSVTPHRYVREHAYDFDNGGFPASD